MTDRLTDHASQSVTTGCSYIRCDAANSCSDIAICFEIVTLGTSIKVVHTEGRGESRQLTKVDKGRV